MWKGGKCFVEARAARFPRLQRRSYTTQERKATLHHLKIGKHTRVIYQGFTGKVATSNAKQSIEYGTNVVGGVTPGKEGEHLGLPLLPSLRAAKDQLKPDATAIFVPGTSAAAAIEEAIEAEIPLIVAVAEHIPVHDMARIIEMLCTTKKSRLVGANSPGIISPLHSCRIGFQPLPMYKPGNVGMVAKSGTLSYEAVGSLSRAGVGQSLCIGAGGDVLSGTSLTDGLDVLLRDPDTDGIVLIGEIGGATEMILADMLQKRADRRYQKPVVALVAGRTAPRDKVMGHAGAFTRADPGQKYRTLQSAGAVMVDHPEAIGGVMKTLLAQAGRHDTGMRIRRLDFSTLPRQQMRQIHTHRRPGLSFASDRQVRCMHSYSRPKATGSMSSRSCQRRHLILPPRQTQLLISKHLPDVQLIDTEADLKHPATLMLSFDRTWSGPDIYYEPQEHPGVRNEDVVGQYSIGYFISAMGQRDSISTRLWHRIKAINARAGWPKDRYSTVGDSLVPGLIDAFREYEALTLSVTISEDEDGIVSAYNPIMHVDDAAFRTAGRQKDVFALRDTSAEDPIEVESERHGIVYVTLNPGDGDARIGTLVNGAGLAMNTVDVLSLPPYEGKCTNFLDTGGKATAETVKRSFELILKDERVKVIFVNIFGGLTDCGMIADGVMLAFKEVDMRGTPVVVRLRGTNEEIGQRKIEESGLGLESFDSFADAAKRVVELAGGSKTGGGEREGGDGAFVEAGLE